MRRESNALESDHDPPPPPPMTPGLKRFGNLFVGDYISADSAEYTYRNTDLCCLTLLGGGCSGERQHTPPTPPPRGVSPDFHFPDPQRHLLADKLNAIFLVSDSSHYNHTVREMHDRFSASGAEPGLAGRHTCQHLKISLG